VQTLTDATSTVRDITSNPVCYAGATICSTGNTQFGWTVEPSRDQRAADLNPVVDENNNALVFNTTIPYQSSPNTCAAQSDRDTRSPCSRTRAARSADTSRTTTIPRRPARRATARALRFWCLRPATTSCSHNRSARRLTECAGGLSARCAILLGDDQDDRCHRQRLTWIERR